MKNSHNEKSGKSASNNSSLKETTNKNSGLWNNNQGVRNTGSSGNEKNSSNDSVKDLVDKNNC